MKKLRLFMACLSLSVFLFSCENDGALIEEETLILNENSLETKDLEVLQTYNEKALINLFEQNVDVLLRVKKNANISKKAKHKILTDMLEQSVGNLK